MASRRRRPKQLSLLEGIRTWGGKRAGAGRKRRGPQRVAHTARAPHKERVPVHVTLRLRDDLPTLRSHEVTLLMWRLVEHYAGRDDFRIIHFTLQDDHIHLLVEVTTKDRLSWAMRSFAIRFARGFNKLHHRTGKVFADRYHRHDLETPKEVHRSLGYVLENWIHHGAIIIGGEMLDPYSSAYHFDGWANPTEPAPIHTAEQRPPRARTWLLRVGYREHGLVQNGRVFPKNAVPARLRSNANGNA
jgi:putative transposase